MEEGANEKEGGFDQGEEGETIGMRSPPPKHPKPKSTPGATTGSKRDKASLILRHPMRGNTIERDAPPPMPHDHKHKRMVMEVGMILNVEDRHMDSFANAVGCYWRICKLMIQRQCTMCWTKITKHLTSKLEGHYQTTSQNWVCTS